MCFKASNQIPTVTLITPLTKHFRFWHHVILTIIAGMFCIGSPLNAQEEIFTFKLYYETWGDQVEDVKLVETFIDLVDEKLEKQSFSIQFINSNSDSNDHDSDVNIIFNFLGKALNIHAIRSPLSEISPILFEPFHNYRLAPDEPRTQEGASSLVTAVLFYTHSRCDLAEPYWQNAWNQMTFYNDASYIPILEGNCAILRGDYTAAIKLYESRERRTRIGGGFEFYPNIAWSYLQIGDSAKAYDLMDTLIYIYNHADRDKTEYEIIALTQRAQLYALAERHDDAIVDLTAGIELDSTNSELYILRGQMYLALYEWDSALGDYNTAIELDPAYADAYYERGVLYYSILQTGVEIRADALADFQHYLELAPNGDHAEDAARSIEQITAELAALDG